MVTSLRVRFRHRACRRRIQFIIGRMYLVFAIQCLGDADQCAHRSVEVKVRNQFGLAALVALAAAGHFLLTGQISVL